MKKLRITKEIMKQLLENDWKKIEEKRMKKFYKIEEIKIEYCGGNNYCFENNKEYLFDIPKIVDCGLKSKSEYVDLNTNYYRLVEVESEFKNEFGETIIICESWKIYKHLGNAKKELLKLMNL